MSGETLRARLLAALDPLDSFNPAARAAHSDFDLNPDFRPAERPVLRDAAVLIPIVQRPEGATVLLTRRSDNMRSHTGQVAFPGGRFDPGEGPVEAALREAWEEVGLESGFIEPLGLSHRYETVTGFIVTPVVALVRPGFTLTLNPDEVAEAFETPFDWLMDEANHVRAHYDLNGRRRFYYQMPWEGRNIWGATAGMIRALRARLAGEEGDTSGRAEARDEGVAEALRPTFRPYRPEDAPVLADVYVRSVRGIGARDYTPEQVEAWAGLGPSPRRLDALMRDGRTRLVAADGDDRPVAFADLEPDGHIHFLYCAPEAAGVGVASELYERLEAIAHGQAIPRLYAEASEAARRFFLGQGFTVVRRRDFDVGGVPIHNYAVEKVLG